MGFAMGDLSCNEGAVKSPAAGLIIFDKNRFSSEKTGKGFVPA